MGLTFLRLLLLPFFLFALIAGPDHLAGRWHWAAVAIFAVMAITDKLDGYLARKLNQASRLGAMLDPVADKLLITCSVFILAIERVAPVGYAIPWWVVFCVYAKDVVTVVGVVILTALTGPVRINPHWPGRISTFFQLLLVLLTLTAGDLHAWWPTGTPTLFLALWWVVAAVSVLAMLDYVLLGLSILRQRQRTNGASEPAADASWRSQEPGG